ncbi:MAG: L-seryl-tRNA(Sec) selenium transferase, partial [Rhizobiales bacterium]|nr:L-seryl-tRNA(Sec) selenium transferase [Hyphomicrobiales bacterium]
VNVELRPSRAEIGSGALPVEYLKSRALVISPAGKRGGGRELRRIAESLRGLPIPVIGYVLDDALWLDLRALGDEAGLVAELQGLSL